MNISGIWLLSRVELGWRRRRVGVVSQCMRAQNVRPRPRDLGEPAGTNAARMVRPWRRAKLASARDCASWAGSYFERSLAIAPYRAMTGAELGAGRAAVRPAVHRRDRPWPIGDCAAAIWKLHAATTSPHGRTPLPCPRPPLAESFAEECSCYLDLSDESHRAQAVTPLCFSVRAVESAQHPLHLTAFPTPPPPPGHLASHSVL